MSDGRLRRWGDGPEDEDKYEGRNYVPPDRWKGKMIRSAARIRAEVGRTYSQYLCVVFEDDSRAMLGLVGDGKVHDPRPSVDMMRMAPDFFSPEDIADRVLRIEKKKRARTADEKRSKRLQIEKLQRELARMEE